MSILKNILKPVNNYINIKKEITNTEQSIHNTKKKIDEYFAYCLDNFARVDEKLESLKASKNNEKNSNNDNLLKDQMKLEILIIDEIDFITNNIISIGKNNLKFKYESKLYSKDCLQDLLETNKIVNKVKTLRKHIKQVRSEIMLES